MTRLIGNYGWETGDSNPPSGTSGEIKTVETDPHAGVKHVEVVAVAKTTEAHRANWTGLGYVNNRDYFLRFYVKKSANPSGTVNLCTFGSLVNGHYGEVLLLNNGKLRLRRNGSVVVGSDTAELANNTYYYVELRIRLGTTTSNGQIEARLNGVSFASNNAANLGTVSAPDQLRIGACNSSGGTGGVVLRWDDVAVNDNQGGSNNSWVGATASTLLKELADSVTVADSTAILTAKALADTTTISDALAKAAAKVLGDSATVSDLAAKAAQKILGDSAKVSDVLEAHRLLAKALADTVAVGDSITKAIFKRLADAASTSDSSAKVVDKRLADTVAVGDSSARSVFKRLLDAVAVKDAISFPQLVGTFIRYLGKWVKVK